MTPCSVTSSSRDALQPDLFYSLFGRRLPSLSPLSFPRKGSRSFNPDSDEPFSVYQERQRLLNVPAKPQEDVSHPDKIRSLISPLIPLLPSLLKLTSALTSREARTGQQNPDSDDLPLGTDLRITKRRLTADEVEPEDHLMDILKTGKFSKKGLEGFNSFDYKRTSNEEVDGNTHERTFIFYGRLAWKYIKHILKVFWKAIERENFDRELVLGPFAESSSQEMSSRK